MRWALVCLLVFMVVPIEKLRQWRRGWPGKPQALDAERDKVHVQTPPIRRVELLVVRGIADQLVKPFPQNRDNLGRKFDLDFFRPPKHLVNPCLRGHLVQVVRDVGVEQGVVVGVFKVEVKAHFSSFNMKFPHGNKVSKRGGCTRRFEYNHKRTRSG